jgi:ribosomal-protein-alanine N-acetyltransferase
MLFVGENVIMQFKFKPMNEKDARAIADWHYEGIYSFYDMDQDIDDLEDLLDPRGWVDKYFSVVDKEGDLVGFFSFENDDDQVEVGLGMKPEFTGKGLGQGFVAAGLEFARRKFHPAKFCLNVATFNKRAISVYEKVGFIGDRVFIHETNGGQHEFLRMVKEG